MPKKKQDEKTVEKEVKTEVEKKPTEKKSSFTVKKLVKNPVRLSPNVVLHNFSPYELNNLELNNKDFMDKVERSIKQKLIEKV